MLDDYENDLETDFEEEGEEENEFEEIDLTEIEMNTPITEEELRLIELESLIF